MLNKTIAGLLGLKNLVYFAEYYTDVARAVLTGSHHPKHGCVIDGSKKTPPCDRC